MRRTKSIAQKPARRERGQASRQPSPPPEVPEQAEFHLTDQELRAKISLWTVAPERGFKLDNDPYCTRYRDLAQLHGWERFVQQPEPACLPIVHEFYTQLRRSRGTDRVNVFGVEVDFSAATINALFGIPDLDEEDGYGAVLQPESRPQLEHVNKLLTLGKKKISRVPRNYTAQLKSLCGEAKVWRKWMTGALFGATGEGETNEEQQLLLYCVVMGIRFDVGNIIHNKICAIRERLRNDSTSQMALAFPSLITTLCHAVQVPEGAAFKPPTRPFSRRDYTDGQLSDPTVREFFEIFWPRRNDPHWVTPIPDVDTPPGSPRHSPMHQSPPRRSSPPPTFTEYHAPPPHSPQYAPQMHYEGASSSSAPQYASPDFQMLHGYMANQFADLRGYMDARYAGVEQRFTRIEERMSAQFAAMQVCVDENFQDLSDLIDHRRTERRTKRRHDRSSDQSAD